MESLKTKFALYGITMCALGLTLSSSHHPTSSRARLPFTLIGSNKLIIFAQMSLYTVHYWLQPTVYTVYGTLCTAPSTTYKTKPYIHIPLTVARKLPCHLAEGTLAAGWHKFSCGLKTPFFKNFGPAWCIWNVGDKKVYLQNFEQKKVFWTLKPQFSYGQSGKSRPLRQ